MGTEKYIVILPVVELELDLYKFSENRYTWLQLWDDLKSLNGKCINKFKIFVDQEGISSSPPKLFILTLIDANSKDEAYKKGTEKILELVNSLVFLFLRGFEPIHHEAIVVPFCLSNHPLPVEDSIDLERIKVVIKTKNVDKIITPYGEWKFNPLLQGEASHKEYVTTYFKIRKTECDGKEIQVPMLRKDMLLNIENRLKVMLSESNIEGELKNTIATLYSAATTIENIPISYLLLWQILESFASSKDAGGKLLAGTTMNNIKEFLQKEDYDIATIHRINSMLGMLEKKNPTQIIAEIFREYLFPNENIAVLKQKVEKLKKIRNNITHPEPSKRLEGNELQTNYKELRGIVDKLLREIKNQKVSCET